MQTKGHFDGIKEDVPFFKKCSRFEPNSHIHDHHSALIYLKLRNDGCQKHLAQKFCEKAYCRVDSTREFDGPLGHKVVRIKKPKGVITTINGWTSTRPHYDLGVKYSGSPEDFLDDDVQSKYFEKHFRKHEEKIKEDYKSKIHSLKLYFEDINAKCNFTKLSPTDLYAKLKYENNQLKRGTKWKNLEIISGQTSGRWIDEDQMITPIINTYASPTSAQMPSSPSNMFSKTVRTRAASQDFVYDTSAPSSQRFDYVDEKLKSPKHHLRSEATTQYTFETKTPRIPESELDEGVIPIPRTISLKIPQLGIKMLELDGLEDNLTSSRDDLKPLHNIQSDDFSNFLKAYEELESQTRLLYQLTNEGPETFHYMTKKEKANANRKQSLLYPGMKHQSTTKTKMNKNDGLADEFNRINYFYYNKDGKNDDSPQERKKIAEQMMKTRKEKQKIEKSIFEAIVRGQAQKDHMEEKNAIDTQNIEMLKKKIEEVKSLLRRKVGLDVFESSGAMKGISRQESMASNYTNSSARSLPKSQMSGPGTASVQVSPRPHNVQVKVKPAPVTQKSIFQKGGHRKNYLSVDGMPPKLAKTSQVSFSPTRV